MKDLLARLEPNIDEIILALAVATIGSIVFFTVFDINVHDGYVLDDISDCFASNLSDRCEALRIEHGCDTTDQLCIGERYWDTLVGTVLWFGAVFFILRVGFGKLAGAETSGMLFLIGFMWFFSAVLLFYFGWLDLLYYVFQDISIPTLAEGGLPWLNHAGFFSVVKIFGSDPNLVEDIDMYILNALGLIILLGGWYLVAHAHRNGILQKYL